MNALRTSFSVLMVTSFLLVLVLAPRIYAQSPAGPVFDIYDGRRGDDQEKKEERKAIRAAIEASVTRDGAVTDPQKLKLALLSRSQPTTSKPTGTGAGFAPISGTAGNDPSRPTPANK